jgi:hypothetical protein
MFERPQHQLIAQLLLALDSALLLKYKCLFGDGTAVVLRYGEYRLSMDIAFLVSDLDCYRQLRLMSTGTGGIFALFRENVSAFLQARPVRADQCGIRTQILFAGQPIKLEIVLEGRIELEQSRPDDEVLGVATLTPLDMLTEKLLANSDRWADEGVFNRDLIDMVMMQPDKALLTEAVAKASKAYGSAIIADLVKATDKFLCRPDWLERCMKTMGINVPKALLLERIRTLRRKIQDA